MLDWMLKLQVKWRLYGVLCKPGECVVTVPPLSSRPHSHASGRFFLEQVIAVKITRSGKSRTRGRRARCHATAETRLPERPSCRAKRFVRLLYCGCRREFVFHQCECRPLPIFRASSRRTQQCACLVPALHSPRGATSWRLEPFFTRKSSVGGTALRLN